MTLAKGLVIEFHSRRKRRAVDAVVELKVDLACEKVNALRQRRIDRVKLPNKSRCLQAITDYYRLLEEKN